MNNNIGIVYLPAANGLPGAETRHLERLRNRFPALDWRHCLRKDEVPPLLPRARAALVWAFSSGWSDLAPNLRLISTPAAGRELVRAVERPGLRITYGSFHGELMAETVLGMMLAFTRGIKDSLDRRDEVWPRVEVGSAMRPLRGRCASTPDAASSALAISAGLSP